MEHRPWYTCIVLDPAGSLSAGVARIALRMPPARAGIPGSLPAPDRSGRLLWYERYATRERALARALEIQTWARARKIALVGRTNPAWIDLGPIDLARMDLAPAFMMDGAAVRVPWRAPGGKGITRPKPPRSVLRSMPRTLAARA